jgi:hypothetical protein
MQDAALMEKACSPPARQIIDIEVTHAPEMSDGVELSRRAPIKATE